MTDVNQDTHQAMIQEIIEQRDRALIDCINKGVELRLLKKKVEELEKEVTGFQKANVSKFEKKEK